MMQIVLLLIAFALVLLNAFFVAAEFGMVKLRHTRVAVIMELYGFRGRILSYIHQHLDAYLSACQLGITLASLGLGWVGEPAVAELLQPIFSFLGIKPHYASAVSFIIAFSILSFLHIVVGELMPKSLAIRQSEKVSIWTAVPLYGFYWLMYPAIWFLNFCSNFLLKITGLARSQHGEHFYSTDEIKLILSASHLHGELSKEEVEILEHTLDFADLKVTEVIRPREEMVMLNLNESVQKNMNIVMQHRYSRYPVYDAATQEISGIIHVKDLFTALYQHGKIPDFKLLLRPVLKVPQRWSTLDLLHKFREGMPHFALVYSKKGALLGFVTLDNLLHVLIGRIKDEFHRTQEDWTINPDGSLSVKGDCSIYSLERALNLEIDPGEEEIETFSGLVFTRLHSIPKVGDRIHFEEFDVVIEKMRASRILMARIYPH
ncbi:MULTISPECIES: hemolysin family protein [Legionella]|uniref:HlyC/CorC family transporter n=1 Tax=Legionella septentrionalis TaxID=2498109 RepID=A0A3S0V9F9_9GAMM|nr:MULTISPECIES: hemolysin family protein [Legionella]MCP0914648.1 hemolysin family protein [Legionella sp. 27cVA30]RUQ81014.1 HlyC/CorC family transporter [Legionella septentrionalis]RUQ99350.1 HlyC/CorC family transporter [Legionella septentrionalis]RUR08761.1 HlyC/CorC family transporter [Legionella septentrionalis]RUR13326.1 HlyC/CorC family transporter [Legionella septentrionalis]